jgi:hypothetical protein
MKMSMDRLRDAGYQIIAVPDDVLIPWTIIDGNTNEFKSWGPIWKLTEKDVRPEIKKDITGPDVLVKECDELIEAKAGLSILNRLGIKGVNLSSGYKNANKFRIVYLSILKDTIDMIDICRYIRDNNPDMSLFGEQLNSIDEKGEAAIIFETLKSNQIDFVAYDEKGVEVKVGVEAEVATATGEFKMSTTNANTLCYKGAKSLVFAYHALPFWIQKVNGTYEFRFSVKEKVNVVGPGGYPLFTDESSLRGKAGVEGEYMMMGGGGHRSVPRYEEQSRIITPEYVKSLEKNGSLKMQCELVFKPDYKIYSPKTMIERVE